MKGFKSTGLLTLVVAVLAGYTYYEFRKADQDAQAERGEINAFTFKKDDVDSVLLTNRGEVTEVRKVDGKWQMLKPVQDLGDGPVTDGYLYTVLGQKFKSLHSEGESKDVNWADYGLEPAAVTLQLGAGGKTESFSVSEKKAYDGSPYVRKDGQLLLGDKALTTLAERPATSFRSRAIFRDTPKEILSAHIQRGKDSYRLIKKDGGWHMEPKPSFKLGQDRVEEWLDQILSVMPSDFAAEALTDAQKSDFLLAKPAAVITLEYSTPTQASTSWTLTLGQDKAGEVYLYTTTRPTVYKTSRSSLEKVHVGAEHFRDGKEPFQFPIEQVQRVELNTGKLSAVILKSEQNWALEKPRDGEELDQDQLVEFFQNVKGLSTEGFSAQAGAFGAAPSVRPQIVLKDSAGKTLFTLAWGAEDRAKQWRAARSNLAKEYLKVAKDKIDRLVDARLVKTKKPETK